MARTAFSILPLFLLAVAAPAWADDTQTLPQGIARVRIRPVVSIAQSRWNQDGKSERITNDFHNRNLNSEVFPELAILERIYGYKSGSLTLGRSQVLGTLQVGAMAVAAEYGITDRLSIGVVLPIVHARHAMSQVDLVPETSCGADRCGMSRNLGDTSISVDDTEYLPLDHDKSPDTRLAAPLTREDVQNILQDDLEYQRLESWSGSGLGDLELGIKYRALAVGPYATSVQGGFRLPTGRIDDPDNLLDIPFGDGQTDLGLQWQNDFRPFKDWLFNATLRYTVQLPHYERKRIPPAVNVPLAGADDVESVYRNLGDIFEAEASILHQFAETWRGFVVYRGILKAEDIARGSLGLPYSALTDETALRDHRITVGGTFSTVPLVLRNAYWLPLDITLMYERSIAGKNNALIANTVSFEVAGYLEVL